MGLFDFLKKNPAQDSSLAAKDLVKKDNEPVEKQVKKEPVKLEPLDQRLLKEPGGMSLFEKHYFYEEQIHAFYKRRDEDPKYINMTIAACEKQTAIAKDVAKKRLAGKKRYTLKTDKEIMADAKGTIMDDLKTIQGTKEQADFLARIDKMEKQGGYK